MSRQNTLQTVGCDVFGYVLRAVRERATPVRKWDSSIPVVWLHELPKDAYCRVFLSENEPDDSDGRWLTVRRPPAQDEAPPPPPSLRPWFTDVKIDDPSVTPIPLEQMEIPDPDDPDKSRLLRWTDQAELLADYEEYLQGRWGKWAESERRWKPIRETYARMHSILMDIEKRSEEVDLVLGCAFLQWRLPSGYEVGRHLVTCRATMVLDAKTGRISVGPAEDGSRAALEEDMLDPEDRPHTDQANQSRGLVADLDPEEICAEAVDQCLAGWRASLHAECVWDPGGVALSECGSKPIICFAPALILRPRNQRSLVEMYEKIVAKLEQGAEPSLPLQPLLDPDAGTDPDGVSTGAENDGADTDAQILLPLPSNEEQKRIIHRLGSRSGVLVQGPPGTGKSHTIANLLCHLLASGNRVLVTSQGPRALRVLKDKLPQEIQPLCVSVLGADPASRLELEKCVRGVTDRQATWQATWFPSLANLGIFALEDHLHEAQAECASLQRRMIEVLQKDTYTHEVAEGSYSGTALEIARRTERERSDYGWLTDSIGPDADVLHLQRGFLELYDKVKCAGVAAEDLQRVRPPSTDLPDSESFRTLCQSLETMRRNCQLLADEQRNPEYAVLARAQRDEVEHLRQTLSELIRSASELGSQDWVRRCIEDVVAGRMHYWERLRGISSALDELIPEVEATADVHLDLPGDRNAQGILEDAEVLKGWYRSSLTNRISSFLTDASVRRALSVRKAEVNGRGCNTVQQIELLQSVLNLELKLQHIEEEWQACTGPIEGTRRARVAWLADMHTTLIRALDYARAACDARGLLANIGIPVSFAWTDTCGIASLVRVCDCILAEHDLDDTEKKHKSLVRRLEEFSHVENAHPICTALLKAVQDLDLREYDRCRHYVEALEEIESQAGGVRTLLPRLIEDYLSSPEDTAWPERLSTLRNALKWSQARAWLEQFLRDTEDSSLGKRYEEANGRVQEVTAQLAAQKAWSWCLSRLTEPQRQALVAWKQAIKKRGKGTGKSAIRLRKAAREHLRECRDAIPAWIMPIHSVLETVEPEPGMYDVVIVDEASQCGIESLFLLFLAKKVLIVGDDEQISPEQVGLSEELIAALQQEGLADVPARLRTALDLRTSLFALAEYAYKDRIVLTEHFRCMPEIIGFSDEICYAPHGIRLKPLRHYASDRLPPIRPIHVPDGMREGGGQEGLNRPEADALVDKLLQCHRDPAYSGKTFGVISLLGARQATYIERKLREQLGPEALEERRIRCGDAYHFQGDERDVMFISVVAAPGDTRLTALTSDRYRQRFNVAVSRARDQLWLFHTATINDIPNPECLRRQLIEYCYRVANNDGQVQGFDYRQLEQQTASEGPDWFRPPFQSRFELEVALDIARRGFQVTPQYKVGVYSVDLVIEGPEGRRIAVECDGDRYHGEDQYEQDLARQRILERTGLVFFRVRGSAYYKDRTEALEPLWNLLQEKGFSFLAVGPQTVPANGRSTALDRMAADSPRTEEDVDDFDDEEVADEADETLPARAKLNDLQWRDAILDMLRACPNNSCTKESVPIRVLRHLKIRTHSGPRRECERRILRALDGLIADGRVEEYTATNVRVRLRRQTRWY